MKTHILLSIIAITSLLLFSCSKENTGNEKNSGDTVTDIDGNTYHTVQIGTQTWMVENLKTTKLNDGTALSLIPANKPATDFATPAYSWYDNDLSNKEDYGALYNWFAVNDSRLAPKGWKIPTESDWQILEDYLCGAETAGDKLKEAGNTHWLYTNTTATNSSGFTALPGGYHNGNTTFEDFGYSSGIWINKSIDATHAGYVIFSSSRSSTEFHQSSKFTGVSVRCLKATN